MSISIIIATQPKRRMELDRLLQSLEKEHCSEIIVVSEGNLSEARNKGVRDSHGDLLVFVDDDAVLREGCLKELLKPFKDPQVGIVGGVNICLPGAGIRELVAGSLYASHLAMFRSAARYTPIGVLRESDESELLTCFMAIRRKAFKEGGGFPVGIIPCEETVLVNQIQSKGWKAIYNPYAVVYHHRPKIFREYWAKSFHYGKGRGKLIRYGKGGMKMVWKPSWVWAMYPVALLGHYISYISGILWGYLRG